jgi:predicted RNA-binding Zn ribbon-like protein
MTGRIEHPAQGILSRTYAVLKWRAVQRAHLLAGRPQPGGRDPAPGALALVQDLVNTVDREHGPDLLDDTAGLADWLALRDLDGRRVTPTDLDHARELREALRGLLLANNGEPEPPDARVVLEAAARRAHLAVRLPADGAALTPLAPGVDGALGQVVAAALVAMWDGTWARLKACPRDVCHWAFYDRSPNASATWCAMSICGSRTKARAYYRRRRALGAC